ncbi:MAG TPA: PIG-L family deacetylase [Chryseosolibacter sp.]|jgi:LmbE family N-acetylglucosaminyl deacetylase|nr:PIG-L family deacetylase [Chryseosolibacter sp.]
MNRLLFLLFILPFALLAQQKEKPRKCIMVFGAHADDADENAGGTLAKYVAMGYEGIYVVAINNLDGNDLRRTPWYDSGPDFSIAGAPHIFPAGALETSQMREEEARQAAAVYPATPIFLNFKEPTFFVGRLRINYDQQQYYEYAPPGRPLISLASHLNKELDVVVDLLRKYKPEIVITHTLGGEKLDHGNAAYLIYLAFRKAMDENVPVGKLWMVVNGWLLDEPASTNGRGKPDVHIDVRDFLKTKYEAINKHISQNGGFGRDYVTGNKTQPREVIEDFITVIDNTRDR